MGKAVVRAIARKPHSPIQDGFGGSKGREVANKVHDQLKQAGGSRPPTECVFMDRATVGIGGVMMHLRANFLGFCYLNFLVANVHTRT